MVVDSALCVGQLAPVMLLAIVIAGRTGPQDRVARAVQSAFRGVSGQQQRRAGCNRRVGGRHPQAARKRGGQAVNQERRLGVKQLCF